MEQSKLSRINELAAIKKTRELTAGELKERDGLRAEYLAEWRRNAERVLDSVHIDDGKGNVKKLEKKAD